MAKHPYLLKRSGRYYYRRRVPDDLREAYGKKEIKFSLETGDYKSALERAQIKTVTINNDLNALRKKISHAKKTSPSSHQLESMVISWFHEKDEKQKKEDAHLLHDSGEINLTERLNNMHDDFAVWYNPEEVELRKQWADSDIQKILKKNHAALKPDSEQYQKMTDTVIRANKELIERRRHRLSEHSMKDIVLDALFSYSKVGAGNTDKPSLSLREVVEQFLGDPTKTVTEKTVKAYQAKLGLLCEILGENTPIREINRTRMENVMTILKQFPPNSKKLFPGCSVDSIVQKAAKKGLPTLGKKTINHHMEHYSAFFRYAEKMEYIDKNPATGLRMKITSLEKKDAKHPFDMEQLNGIFANISNWRWGKGKPPADCLWVPVIALYSGMRLSEVCQLYIEDIQAQNGIDVFSLNTNKEKTLKTESAMRKIPIHSKLIELGLLDFVTAKNEAGQERLFSEIPTDNSFKRYGQWFNKGVKKFQKPDNNISFHSFRHTAKDEMQNNGVDLVTLQTLGGWKSEAEGTEKIYGGGLTLKNKKTAIEKMCYEGLDLTTVEKSLHGDLAA